MSQTVFDQSQYVSFNKARIDFLDVLLETLKREYVLKTALDIGCGLGYFSNYLHDKKFDVIGVDARQKNILEARKRYPHLQFGEGDLQSKDLVKYGSFDLVLCFGLLYHLENPFLAIRNLSLISKRIVLIESMIDAGKQVSARLVSEGRAEDQSLNYIAFMPTEACFVKMLYAAGFRHVYRPKSFPLHPDFEDHWKFGRRRTILLASKPDFKNSPLKRIEEPTIKPEYSRNYGSLKGRYSILLLVGRVVAKLRKN